MSDTKSFVPFKFNLSGNLNPSCLIFNSMPSFYLISKFKIHLFNIIKFGYVQFRFDVSNAFKSMRQSLAMDKKNLSLETIWGE